MSANTRTNVRPEGKPPKYSSSIELQNKIDEYFTNCPDKREVVTDNGKYEVSSPTIAGLAYFLGFESRQSLYDYEGRNNEYSYVIKRARVRVESMYERQLSGTTPTGSIFALKNMGWRDKSEIDMISKEYKYIEYGDMTDDDLDEQIAAIARGQNRVPSSVN